MRARISRPALVVATLALAGSALAFAPAAEAAPVFVDANTQLGPYNDAHDDSGACTATETNGNATPVPLVENGAVASTTTNVTGTFQNDTVPADTGSASAQATVTGRVTSAGGNVSTMDFTQSGSAQVDFAQATSGCEAHVYAGGEVDFAFTLAQAGFLHITTKTSGSGQYGFMSIGDMAGTVFFEHSGGGSRFTDQYDVYLPAGTYGGYFGAESVVQHSVDRSVAGSTTVHAEFDVAGSQTVAVSGKGKKYTTLPSARSCATHTVVPTVTGKKARASKIKQIAYFVNDAKVKKVKTPKKGATVTLAVSDTEPVDLRAEVTLFPKKKGKPAKSYEVSASYEACS